MLTKRQSVFQRLKDPPSFTAEVLEPLYHSKNGNYIYIFVEDTQNDDHQCGRIWQYNLDQQKVTKKYTKLEDVQYLNFRYDSCIDQDNDIIYFMGGSEYIFKSFNLNTNQWSILPRFDTTTFINCYYIPSPINQLHITSLDHFVYNRLENKLVKLDNDTSLFQRHNRHWAKQSSYIYHKSKGTLIMFQGDYKYILCCDIDEKNKTVSDWRKYDIGEIPENKDRLFFSDSFILGWDQVIFWFDDYCESIKDAKIWCLDLEHNDKWYQSPHNFPDFEYKSDNIAPYVIKDDDNYAHLMSFWADDNRHFKVSLWDLLPTEIIKMNRERFDALIIGYIKEFEKRNTMIFIPMYLKKIIVQFYPLFV